MVASLPVFRVRWVGRAYEKGPGRSKRAERREIEVSKLMTRPRVAGNRRRHVDQDGVWGDRRPFRFVKDDKVVVGKDDWLFLDNDSNGFLRQYAGEAKLSEQQLDQWRELLETRTNRLAELGARYYFLTAPESPPVYPEKLPDGIRAADERAIHQLMRHLDSSGSAARLIYPLEQLLTEKARRLVYSKTDTHWNDFGAFAAYRRLARELARDLSIHEVCEEELEFFEADILGDLGYKLGIPAGPETCARYLYARASKLYDNRVDRHGSLVITECPHAPPTKCVVFGDSSCYGLMTFLSQSFGRLVVADSATLDFDLIEEERPDVVISEMAERFLIVVPNDAEGRPVRELECEKAAKGMLRPRVQTWDPSPVMPAELRVASIETVETARALFRSQGRQDDATLISLMAYAGLSPAEALRLSWRQLENGALLAEPSHIGHESAEATERRRRSVPLLGPLRDDLAAWRVASGSPRRGYVFPELRKRDWQKWMRKEYRAVIRQARRPGLGPSALCDTFAALLIGDGASPSEVARLMGIERADVLGRYWYLLDETVLGTDTDGAAERIREARATIEARVRSSTTRVGWPLRLWKNRLPAKGPGIGWEALPRDSLGVRPLSVETVEKVRARLLSDGLREEATFVSVMAYAGLRPNEALPLKWQQVGGGTLEIRRAYFAPQSEAAKNVHERSVQLLEPLAKDLAAWHAACGSPQRGWVFPSLRDQSWREWIGGVYQRAAKPAGKGRRKPHYLIHTFSLLLIQEGMSLGDVARQTGLSQEDAVTHYAHLFEEARAQGAVSASARIHDARAALGVPRRSGFVRMLRRLRHLPAARETSARALPKPEAAIQEDA